MKLFLTFLGIFLAAISLEGTISYLPLTTLRVDIIWILVLYVGFYGHFWSGSAIVLALGFLQESFGAPFHGLLIFTYLVVFYFLKAAGNKLSFQSRFTQVAWVFLLTLAQKGLEVGTLHWQGLSLGGGGWGVREIIPFAFLEGIVSLWVFNLLESQKPKPLAKL